ATSSKGYVESVQYLKEAGWADGGHVIACTQPRRLAAQVLAAKLLFAEFSLSSILLIK
ncbi:hypothetical protein Tco_0119985, partial [Tanacetum coccineum]